jgi:RND family efflux transporter MFP subunit
MKKIRSVIGMMIMAGFLSACGEKPYDKPLVPVRVQTVSEFSAQNSVRYSANVVPDTQVPVAFRVGDYVTELLQIKGEDGSMRNVQEGDWVALGAVMARVRETSYAAKVNQVKSQLSEAEAALGLAKAQVAEAESTRDQAKRDFDRADNLYRTSSITKPEFDGAKTKLDVTQDKVSQANAQVSLSQARAQQVRAVLEEAQSALQDCALKAPLRAMVLKRNVEIGSLVGPGTVGFLLADTSMIKVVFGVPDAEVGKLRVGASLTITSEGLPGVKLRGQISRISSSADPKSRVFDVETTIPNPNGRLKIGMIASLETDAGQASAPVAVVPLSAVVRSKQTPDHYAVFVVEQENGSQVAHLRDVQLGAVFGNTIAVTSGLKVGEKVIVTGATIVSDGERVNIVPD